MRSYKIWNYLCKINVVYFAYKLTILGSGNEFKLWVNT